MMIKIIQTLKEASLAQTTSQELSILSIVIFIIIRTSGKNRLFKIINYSSFERRVNQHFNNSMVAAIYQQRPGGNNRRPKKGNSAQNYSAYAQKFISKPHLTAANYAMPASGMN